MSRTSTERLIKTMTCRGDAMGVGAVYMACYTVASRATCFRHIVFYTCVVVTCLYITHNLVVSMHGFVNLSYV